MFEVQSQSGSTSNDQALEFCGVVEVCLITLCVGISFNKLILTERFAVVDDSRKL
jgi:hypothetical protein